MSSYGELIQALGVIKNVKEKRHGIKTLSSLCANRQFQVRIVQRGGWKNAILPLIISLDEDCRKYAALAIANLSFAQATHQQLLDEDVLTHLVPILYSEECPEVVIYVLNALGNFASSTCMWEQMQHMKTVDAVVNTLRHAEREETKLNCLFTLANMTEDPYMRKWMMHDDNAIYNDVWEKLQNPNYNIMEYSLATLRGLSAEASAQEAFARMNIIPILIGIFNSNRPSNLKALSLDIFHHLSFLHSNAPLLMEPNVVACIEEASKPSINTEFVSISVSMIANLCECVELHDAILESPLFKVLNDHILDENVPVRVHVYRAMMQLSLSPRYHHVILSTGAVANACPIAMMDRLPQEVRTNVLQMMGAICATHPTTPTENDIVDILHLCCAETENIEIRRPAAMVLANASSDDANKQKLLQKPYLEVLVLTLSKATDVVLTDYLMMFFHNICKMDVKAGSMLMQAGYHKHMFVYERLESLSHAAAIYLCDTLRQISDDTVVRGYLIDEQVFVTLMDAWVTYLKDPKIMPHLALMCSAFCYHQDCHQDFVLQGGVRLVMGLYNRSKVEHVRLCCVLSLLYLAESEHSQKSICQERAMQTLLYACENETHIDLITNSLKALIPFASSDDYRPQLGMDGALDTFSSFLFSDQLSLQQLGVFLLQNLLELRANRRIFLGLEETKKCEEDYLDPLIKFLPLVSSQPPGKGGRLSKKAMKNVSKKKKDGEEQEKYLTPHDPFIARCAIHCLALLSLEHNEDVHARFIEFQLPSMLFNLFYSEHIDRASGEAIVLFFNNMLHGSAMTVKGVLRGIDVIPMLLCATDMNFSTHTNVRCLSALLCVSRQSEYRRSVLAHIELIMASLNHNLNKEDRDEDFYSAAALHCALLCELAFAPAETHEHLAKVGVIEAFLVFITVAGRGLRDEICIELLMGAVLGISTLVASPTCGMMFMRNLLFPATRLQLFLSLLRLPQEDINSTFHVGTYGIRTLQRTICPNIESTELHVDHLNLNFFLNQCIVRPSDFIYRQVVRTLCLLLADPETRRRVQEAISPQNIVPTCLFSLKGSTDVFVSVFGYVLVASFVYETSLQPAFVSNAVIMNEVLSCCRRSALLATGQENVDDPLVAQLEALGRGGKGWTPKEVSFKRLMLVMSTLYILNEKIKERYRIGAFNDETGQADESGQKALTEPNRTFVKRLAAICLRDIDTDQLIATRQISNQLEYTQMLRIIIAHNSLMTRIELDNRQKGGLVPHLDWKEERRKRPPMADRVVPDLRPEFKNLKLMQGKTDGLLELVNRLITINSCKPLIIAIIEFLCGMTFLSPMSVSSPSRIFDLLGQCPEWLQSNVCLLLTNSLAEGMLCDPEVEDWKDKHRMVYAESDHLFPLIATSSLETRNYILGTLANLSCQWDFYNFVKGTGVFRILKPLPSRAYFAENFAQIIEAVRMVANLSSRDQTHEELANQSCVGFLRDVLRYVCALLHSGSMGPNIGPQAVYTRVDIEFTEEDEPPLGLRIRWVQPAQILEVLPDKPAARLADPLLEGDELMEVNGVDVSEMEHADIAPMFETRPLSLYFRRKVSTRIPTKERNREIESHLQVENVERVEFYGDREQYIECFHLTLLALHNMATTHTTHSTLLAEPKILNLVMELITSDVVVPSLRRLIFSMLTCFAQKKDISGRIFYQMSDYFMACEHADSNLQKYIMLCANLFYTGMSAEEIKPDRSMLLFVGRLSDMQGAETANMALVEILHGMSRAPKEIRGPFVCRETLVLITQFMQLEEMWDVQLRAYESGYFLTLGNCDPGLWSIVDLIPKAVKAAGVVARLAEQHGGTYVERSDALWEITMRMVDLCLPYENLIKYFNNLPDLDRCLIELFQSKNKPPHLAQCASHLMAGLLRSDLGGSCWHKWKSLGIVKMLLEWFQNFKKLTTSNDPKVISQRDSSERGGGNRDFDQVLQMILWALEVDPSFISALCGPDVVFCIGSRIMNSVTFYRKMRDRDEEDALDPSTVEETQAANVSFRTIAQLMTAFTASADGLQAMSRLELESPLVSLLELPPGDFRIPTLLMLCTLAVDHVTCGKLVRLKAFLGLLKEAEATLQAPGSPYPKDELEYMVCILDRSCCFQELARVVQDQLFVLLLLIFSKAETADAQLMSIRAISRCGFTEPSCLDLMPEKGIPAMYLIMAVCGCLKVDAGDGSDKAAIRQSMQNTALAMTIRSQDKAKLATYFARATLCEAVSISRSVCAAALPMFDGLYMLDKMAQEFEDAIERTTTGNEKQDVVCAELLNGLCTMFQTTLCILFQQGTPGGEDVLFEGRGKRTKPARDAVAMLTRIIHSVYGKLKLGQTEIEKTEGATMADMLTEDIRILYYLTALLHEACAKDPRSTFLEFVRTRDFYNMLEATIRLSVKRLKQEIEGPPPRDLFTRGLQLTGEFNSPMTTYIDSYKLSLVFEHQFVCLRHLLVQSMYIPVADEDMPNDPWVWLAQYPLKVHVEALTWMPDVLKRYGQTNPALTVEMVRYVSCIATFYEAPYADKEGAIAPPAALRALGQVDGDADPTVATQSFELPQNLPLVKCFLLSKPDMLTMMLDAMQTQDPCTRTLAALAIANLAEYERQFTVKAKTKQKDLKVEGLSKLVPVMANLLREVHDFPHHIGIPCMAYCVRFFVTCLAYNSQPLVVTVYTEGVWDAVNLVYKQYFTDEYKVEDINEYVTILKAMVTFARNWICSGSLMEFHTRQQMDMRSTNIGSTSNVPGREAETDAEVLARSKRQHKDMVVFSEALQSNRLLNFLVGVVWKLTKSRPEIPDKDELKDFVYEDTFKSYQTLFKRQEETGEMEWKDVNIQRFDQMLEEMHKHRRVRSGGVRDDEIVVNTLYLITKLDYSYTRAHFPDYLMEVAYGKRDEYNVLQDVAAICCAIIFTQSGKGKSSTANVNLNDVISDYKDFVISMSRVPDRKMQLWHFRTITQWTTKPKVLEDCSRDAESLNFIVNSMLDNILGRYAIVFVHNISCLRCWTLVRRHGSIETICEAYRRMVAGSQLQGDNAERRSLRRLMLASVRNCTYIVQDLNADISDGDMAAITRLVSDIEPHDLPFYLSALMNICDRVDHSRAAAILPLHVPLVETCIRQMVEYAEGLNPGNQKITYDETDLYDYKLDDGEEEEEDIPEEPDSPMSPTNEDDMAVTRSPSVSRKQKKAKKQEKEQTKGLGRPTSLYLRARQKGAQRAQTAAVQASGAPAMAPVNIKQQLTAADKRNAEQEYVYFAVIEVLTHTTFKENTDEIWDSVDAAFETHPLLKWLTIFSEQAALHQKDKMSLNDFYVLMTAKFIWHGFSNEMFRHHFEAPTCKEIVAGLLPFFLQWPNPYVVSLATEIALYGRYHNFQNVCEYFVSKGADRYPELAATSLSSALVDPESIVKPYQGVQFIRVFVDLLQSRSLSRLGLRRIALGVETSLLTDHPKGFGAYLIQKESALLADYLEALGHYTESGYVKQSIVVTLVETVGKHYKALPELDEFAIRVLDMAPGLLEDEFVLFLPVLHRLCSVGGKRIQAPVLSRKLHLRIARLFEEAVHSIEMERRRAAAVAAGEIESGEIQVKQTGGKLELTARQKSQWCLAVFAVLGANELESEEDEDNGKSRSHEPNLHFDSFVCVDLLPIFIRILRTHPGSFEAASVLFLVSSVATSPCIAPHMPDLLKLAERSFISRIEHPDADNDAMVGGLVTAQAADLQGGSQEQALTETTEWSHLKLPSSDRAAIGMRRSMTHLLGMAGHLPTNNPALLRSTMCFKFLRRMASDPYLFEDPVAPLHCKLLALANMCTRKEDHDELTTNYLFDILLESEAQINEEATKQPRDLRVVWLHSIVSLAKLSGPAFLNVPKAVKLFDDSFEIAEAMILDSQSLKTARGLALSLQCMDALASVFCPLSVSHDFDQSLRQKYTMYMLCLISTGQLASLRITACKLLAKTVSEGHSPETCGAVLLTTSGAQTMRQLVGGPNDALAADIAQLMIEFVKHAGYDTHKHLLQNLEAIVSMIGDASATQVRILRLSELFLAMTKDNTEEIIDALIEQRSIAPFLSLARSNMASRREICQRWLEAYGSSLYEIDEVTEVFQTSTLRGLLFVAARCTLEPEAAQDLRRILFGLIRRRVDTWRASVFGVSEFLREDLINALVPMCELQPDLVAAVLALFHEFYSKGELQLLDRVWTGGHFAWICKRMAHKSGAQMATARSNSLAVAPVGAHWERHADLICTQGMALRLLWHMYDYHSNELVEKAVKQECIVKNWREYLTYYFALPWPLKDDNDVRAATDAGIILSMMIANRLVMDLNLDNLRKLVAQGMIGMAFAVLLPTPQDQADHRKDLFEVSNRRQFRQEDLMDLEEDFVREAKILAGSVTTRLMDVPDAYRWIQERRVASMCIGMFAQIFHWREFLFVHQGSYPDVGSVPLMERQTSLYMAMLWVLTNEWTMEHLGLGAMADLGSLFLQTWGYHPNPLITHYGLRLVSQYCQVHPVYVAIMADNSKAKQVEEAVHETFSHWDVRELRQVLRILIAALAYALKIPVMPEAFQIGTARSLTKPGAYAVNELMKTGGAKQADIAATKHLLRPTFLSQIITWCEHPKGQFEAPGDTFGRIWALWFVLTVLVHQEPRPKEDPRAREDRFGRQRDVPSETEEDHLLIFPKEIDPKYLERRRRVLDEQTAMGIGGKKELFSGDEVAIPACRARWLIDSLQLGQVLAKTAGKSIKVMMKESQIISNAAIARYLYELPHFLHAAVFTVEGPVIVRCLTQPEKPLNLAALQLIAVISSFHLPLRAQTIGEEFIQSFFRLQRDCIEGIAAIGEGPYDLMARWLHAPPNSLPAESDYRCLLIFMIAQCVCPPLAETPSLGQGQSNAKRQIANVSSLDASDPTAKAHKEACPPVAECGMPPKALLDALAAETLREDLRLRQAQVKDNEGHSKGSPYSTMLCHLLFAMAVMVPQHPKAAANSSAVRGAAFSQLMKVQQIVAQATPSHKLYDPKDGERAKLFLYLRATASIRSALRCITGSWLAADYSQHFNISDEGGRDFIQYCAKHLNQAYNNKTALTRVLGTPWERVMLSQGPTETIAELFLKVCSTDANLAEASKIGGQQALHSLSRYAETSNIRQQATMLLTKLAVMNA